MSALPRVTPIRLIRRDEPFDRAGWFFELKHDGFRAVAYIEHGRCDLVSRNGIKFSRFSTLASNMPGAFDAESAILDGEITAFDEAGISRFDDLVAGRGRPAYAAFDLLYLDGEDLRDRPLWERKSLLETHVTRPFESILYVDHVEDQGIALFERACALDLEGVVAKAADAPYKYASARRGWLKIKNPRYSQARGRGERFSRPRRPG